MTKTQGDIYEEECSECGQRFRALTEKQAKANLNSHMESHKEDEEI